DAINIIEIEPKDNNKGISILQNNHSNDLLLDIELEEKKIALLEYQTRNRKEAAEAKAIELQNQKLKASLKNTSTLYTTLTINESQTICHEQIYSSHLQVVPSILRHSIHNMNNEIEPFTANGNNASEES
ncbi:3941_t:CDS:2, partial [Scutellospora calospora]